MQNKIKEDFVKFLDERTSAVYKDVNRLTEDNRKDEANFEKIRANIYQVLKTIFLASMRTSGEEWEQIRYFGGRLDVMEETWRGSLAKASEHNDTVRVIQEQVKLEVMDEVRKTFKEMWGMEA